jgi:glutamate receptor, ionotropic, plant
MTITYNRSKDVDFTLPYMSSGLSMVVPVRNERSKNARIFLKPLKLDLWLGSLAFFIFTGAVIWALEHRINEDFRGPPSNQLGTVFYFAFSTLVFSHSKFDYLYSSTFLLKHNFMEK